MSQTVISVESLSKSYHLGQIGTGTLTNDLKAWWAKIHGKPNPFQKINNRHQINQKHSNEIIWALNDINFSVGYGEAVGIIGRNGAGKSTLLKVLSRVTAPTSGVVKVRGRIASLLEVGTGFHPELTGRENIFLNSALLGMDHDETQRKLDAIVEFSGVERYLDTPVKRYSSGMYVRLAFAIAANLDPEILIVDEVLAVGDVEFQKKCLGKMEEVAKGGRTILFVSHNMAAISNLCPTAILIESGKLIETGSSINVIRKYMDLMENNKNDVVNELFQVNNLTAIGPTVNSIKSTNGFIVKFDLGIKEAFWNTIIHITIRDQSNQVIIHELIDTKSFPILRKANKFTIQANFPALNLRPGIFLLFIKLVSDDPGGRQRFVSNPLVINIEQDEADFDNPAILRPKVEWEVNEKHITHSGDEI